MKFALQYLTDFTPTKTMHIDIICDPFISTRDIYILARLNETIKDVNLHIQSYNFGTATQVLHSFFVYEVCDLYLEIVKPTMYNNEPDNQQRKYCAQATLFTIIEQYLRLTHPLMPFVTEELWQRLPNREFMTTVPSIMIANYPEVISEYFNPKVESDMELIKEMISSARSLRSDYRVPNHVKADFYFKTESVDVKNAILKQTDDFCTLAKGNFLNHLGSDDEIPNGCCVKVLSDQCSLFVNVTGLIDIDIEINRMQKEEERLILAIDQLKKKMASVGYDKVPEAVRETNKEKLAASENEMLQGAGMIEAFAAMK